jgi:hypothetical protein
MSLARAGLQVSKYWREIGSLTAARDNLLALLDISGNRSLRRFEEGYSGVGALNDGVGVSQHFAVGLD